MSLRTINARDILDFSLQSLLEALGDSSQFSATGASGEAKVLLTRPERAAGYDPGTVVLEVTEVSTEQHRNAGYVRSVLSQTDDYPAGEQKVEEITSQRIHVTLSFRLIAKTMRGLLMLRGQLEDFLRGNQGNVEYSSDIFSIAVKDFASDPAEATDIKLYWRYPNKLSSWVPLEVPGEQLLNGIFTIPAYVDAYVSKEYNQIWKFTSDITLL